MRVLIFALTTCLSTIPVQAQYSGGSDTADDAYRIATAGDLMLLGEASLDQIHRIPNLASDWHVTGSSRAACLGNSVAYGSQISSWVVGMRLQKFLHDLQVAIIRRPAQRFER